MSKPSPNDSNKPTVKSEDPRKLYEPPKMIALETLHIETGDSNVPENDDGLLES